jgi:flagellar FliJ protein
VRRFRFRLEKLLELRKHVEREWEIKLAESTGKCALIRNRINEITRLIGVNRADRFAAGGTIDYSDIFANEMYSQRLAIELENRKQELDTAILERSEIQKQYLEYSKKRKVLEKLRERREAEYYRLAKYEEFKVLDEIGTNTFLRRQREVGA